MFFTPVELTTLPLLGTVAGVGVLKALLQDIPKRRNLQATQHRNALAIASGS